MLKLHAQFALMISLEELFCCVDDFCKRFEGQWKQQLLGFGLNLRNRPRSLKLSEIMTILRGFHQSCYRNFKTYYQEKVKVEWAQAFPGLVSKRALHRMGSQHVSADVRLESVRVLASVVASVSWTRPRSKSVTTAVSSNTKCLKI
jgi:hypothetical protein